MAVQFNKKTQGNCHCTPNNIECCGYMVLENPTSLVSFPFLPCQTYQSADGSWGYCPDGDNMSCDHQCSTWYRPLDYNPERGENNPQSVLLQIINYGIMEAIVGEGVAASYDENTGQFVGSYKNQITYNESMWLKINQPIPEGGFYFIFPYFDPVRSYYG